MFAASVALDALLLYSCTHNLLPTLSLTILASVQGGNAADDSTHEEEEDSMSLNF
jgi:hypothetical protein